MSLSVVYNIYICSSRSMIDVCFDFKRLTNNLWTRDFGSHVAMVQVIIYMVGV